MPDFRLPDHLPNLRPDRRAQHSSWLPRQRRGTTPQMVGRYPDYDVLEDQSHWDEATRAAVLGRLDPDPGLRFFTEEEAPSVAAFLDLVLDQDREPRVPVLSLIDAKLAEGRLDGYQYSDMPDDRDCWRQVARALDQEAELQGQGSFAGAPLAQRTRIVESLSRGHLRCAAAADLNQVRAFAVCLRIAVAAFYSHPWAWNEIGFGGPAYPRGFMRTGGVGVREPRERPGATDPDPVREVGGGSQ